MGASNDDVNLWVGLSLIPGLGDVSYRKLLHAFGGPKEIYAASYASLADTVDKNIADHIRRGVDRDVLSSLIAWLDDPANHVITLADVDYPQTLLQIPDPPPLLYVKGRRELLNRPSLAVVGSRNATPQGLTNAESFSRNLSDNGLCIVSGLASGIDAAAHRGGLGGMASSIAVVGTGLDIVYPSSNHILAHELAQHGVLISEFPLGTQGKAHNFPRRNRIICGLALGCLVVEAAIRSGSLITARLAAEQGREVFAIPGSIHSPVSKGCHALIKQGAKLVECANDIQDELKWISPQTFVPAKTAREPENDFQPLLDALGFDPAGIDRLTSRSGLTSDTVCAMLLQLELEGRIASLPGGLFQQIIQPR
ncbi:MAG: DNA-processing protein DprA [Betaproteobacteria bacterium]|nr:DNA-processing protein DprA [Betaproteobacteria bacterium]